MPLSDRLIECLLVGFLFAFLAQIFGLIIYCLGTVADQPLPGIAAWIGWTALIGFVVGAVGYILDVLFSP